MGRTLPAATTLVMLLALSSQAHAAACCGEVSAFGDRLTRNEAFATSLGVSMGPRFGSFDREGGFHALAEGTSDWAAEIELDAVVRVGRSLEIGATAGGVVNARSSSTDSEIGGGAADVRARARALLFDGTDERFWPGLSALVSVVVPTGVPASRSNAPLAVDVTGQGAGEVTLGLSADKLFEESFFARLDGSVGFFTPEAVDGARALRSPRLVAALALGPSFSWGSLAIGASHEAEAAPIVGAADGATRRRTEVSLAATVLLGRDVSLLGGLRSTLPVDDFGAEDDARASAHVALRFAYYDPRSP